MHSPFYYSSVRYSNQLRQELNELAAPKGAVY